MRSADVLYSILLLCEPLCVVVIRLIVPVRVHGALIGSSCRSCVPWWLAGGVSAEWVPELLSRVTPQGLDASSRLEERPGWKNLDKVQALVEAVRSRL